MKIITGRISQLRKTTAQWNALSTAVLKDGEIGIEATSNGDKIKVGDGLTTWANLPYIKADSVNAHASTHGVNGSDPITISENQVTNLTTDLNKKYEKPNNGIPLGDFDNADFASSAEVLAILNA